MKDAITAGDWPTKQGNSKPGTLDWELAKALDEGAASKRLRFLLGCLDPEVQARLTQKIKFKRLATPEDWLAIYRPSPTRPWIVRRAATLLMLSSVLTCALILLNNWTPWWVGILIVATGMLVTRRFRARPASGLDNPLLALSEVRLAVPEPGSVMPLADT